MKDLPILLFVLCCCPLVADWKQPGGAPQASGAGGEGRGAHSVLQCLTTMRSSRRPVYVENIGSAVMVIDGWNTFRRDEPARGDLPCLRSGFASALEEGVSGEAGAKRG